MHAWENFIRKQEEFFGPEVINKWLRALKVAHFDSGNLYLEAKDSFQIQWFEEHIRPLLKKHFLNNNFRPIKVHLTLSEAAQPPTTTKSKKEKSNSTPPIHYTFDKLDPSMTLDSFVAGVNNQVIFHFFRELAEKSSAIAEFNPIYLWGEAGCGKTHLLVALTQAFCKKGMNALYVRAETFTEHVVSAIRSSEMQGFRKAYRHVDVLLLDDVHLLARKNATQEEFFHTFNTLHTSSRQIILSSNCSPASLEEIEPRLVSRFEWGINIHFEKLKNEELREMLLRRCSSLNFPLANEVVNFLIAAFPTSLSLNRALEALILRWHFEKNLHLTEDSSTPDKKTAEKMLSDLILQEQKTAPCPEKIITAVSSIYGIRKEDLIGKSQSHEYSLPRQIAMYLCRTELKLPFQTIGKIFKRDHSTVMTSIKQVERKIENFDQELLSSIIDIKNAVQKTSGYTQTT